jgi:mannose-binding lectin 2
LELFIDARNSGEWTPCVKLLDLKLPAGWIEHAHIGLTASTGQLADNHDAISLLVHGGSDVIAGNSALDQELKEKAISKKIFFEVNPAHLTAEDRFIRYEYAKTCLLFHVE